MTTTAITPVVPTRAAEAQKLAASGVTGAAADLILAAGASGRHEARVAAAAAVAASLGPVGPLAILLDAIGVGGDRGLEGRATKRLPPFRILGTGRKNARDGEAWTAAIRDARGRLPQGDVVTALGHPLRIAVGSEVFAVSELPTEWAAWLRALAGTALLSLLRGEKRDDLAWVTFDGEIPAWAEIFNAAAAEAEAAHAAAVAAAEAECAESLHALAALAAR